MHTCMGCESFMRLLASLWKASSCSKSSWSCSVDIVCSCGKSVGAVAALLGELSIGEAAQRPASALLSILWTKRVIRFTQQMSISRQAWTQVRKLFLWRLRDSIVPDTSKITALKLSFCLQGDPCIVKAPSTKTALTRGFPLM